MVKPAIQFVEEGRIPRDVRRAIDRAWARLKSQFPLHVGLTVRLFPSQVIGAQQEDGSVGVFFGCMTPDAREICIACRPSGMGMTRGDQVRSIVETFCHELAHYEQHREGKPLIERGVAQRMKRLFRIAVGDL